MVEESVPRPVSPPASVAGADLGSLVELGLAESPPEPSEEPPPPPSNNPFLAPPDQPGLPDDAA